MTALFPSRPKGGLDRGATVTLPSEIAVGHDIFDEGVRGAAAERFITASRSPGLLWMAPQSPFGTLLVTTARI